MTNKTLSFKEALKLISQSDISKTIYRNVKIKNFHPTKKVTKYHPPTGVIPRIFASSTIAAVTEEPVDIENYPINYDNDEYKVFCKVFFKKLIDDKNIDESDYSISEYDLRKIIEKKATEYIEKKFNI